MTTTFARLLVLPALAVLVSCSGSNTASTVSVAPSTMAPAMTAAAMPTADSTVAVTPSRPSAPPLPTPAAATDPPTPATTQPIVGPTRAGQMFNQPWAVATLNDVVTGEEFRIADLAHSGKVVFVETMAIWCSNCRAQQREAVTAFAELDPARVMWIGLDVEASETADALARYRDQNRFPFRYAIADRDVARALAESFGDVVLSPPSVNLIVLGTDGRVTHELGHHNAAELIEIAIGHGA